MMENATCDEVDGVLRNANASRIPLGYSDEFRIVATLLHVVIFLIGFVGNIAVVIVVKRTRSMHTPTYCYLVSLAISDLLVLLSSVPEAIVSHHLYSGQWILGHFGCSTLVFMNFLGINASSTSILCFTVERYIGICHPLLAQKVCSIERAIKIIAGTWIFAVIYCIPWLGLTTTRVRSFDCGYPDFEQCIFRLKREHYVYFFMTDLVLFYLLPLMVSIILYTRIALVLRTKSSLRKHDKHSQTAVNKEPGSGGDQSRTQVVRMLVVIVTSFALLWLPYRGLLVYNSFAGPWLDAWYLLFAKTLVFMNSATNPILYNAMSKRFRVEFMRVVFCVKQKDRVTINVTAITTSNSAYLNPSVGLRKAASDAQMFKSGQKKAERLQRDSIFSSTSAIPDHRYHLCV